MKKLLLYSALALSTLIGASNADVGSRNHYDRYDRDDRRERYEDRNRDRDDYDRYDGERYSSRSSCRTVYVIENHRPVRRVVYVNPGGGCYHIVRGRRVVIRDRYYTSYPSRYFHSDGRRRIGVSFNY